MDDHQTCICIDIRSVLEMLMPKFRKFVVSALDMIVAGYGYYRFMFKMKNGPLYAKRLRAIRTAKA